MKNPELADLRRRLRSVRGKARRREDTILDLRYQLRDLEIEAKQIEFLIQCQKEKATWTGKEPGP